MAGTGRGATNGRLTKDQLFAAIAVREQDYALPTGGTIRIRGLSAKNGLAVAGNEEEDSLSRVKRVCRMGIVDPVLDDADLGRLDEMSSNAVSDMAMAILALSGLTGQAEGFSEPTPESKASSITARKSSTGSRRR
jgi:hypothetical protein